MISDVPNASQEMAFEPLVGTEEANVDEKGRVRLSAKKQERLGRNFVLFHDPLGCLIAFPQRVWRQKLVEIMARPASEFAREVESRDLGAMAEDDVNADAQGRFVIPMRFRDDLDLKREVVLVGAIDRVEIWQKAEYGKFMVEKMKHAKVRRELAERGNLPATE